MLLVRTYFAPSTIEGFGLFAAEFIPEGTCIWRFDEEHTKTYWKKDFLNYCSQLGLHELKELLKYCYLRGGIIYSPSDNMRYVNHSLNPNVAFRGDFEEYSIRNIESGEEILENYFHNYDTNDFFSSEVYKLTSRNEILSSLRENILSPTKPRRKFLVS